MWAKCIIIYKEGFNSGYYRWQNGGIREIAFNRGIQKIIFQN